MFTLLEWPADEHDLRYNYPYGLYYENGRYWEINREYSTIGNEQRGIRDLEESFTLSDDQIKMLEKNFKSGQVHNSFFLYDDRSVPWTSKRNLEAYNKNLILFRQILGIM
jgi:hypothetical protein